MKTTTTSPPALADSGKPQRSIRVARAGTRDDDERLARRARQAEEREAFGRLNNELAFRGYPDSFGLARRLKREVTLYVGPPNSGKTHAAFERLAKADSGVYLAPLRLLALEGRDRLQARDIACTLLTGEEHVPVPGARVVSSTVEMVNTREPVHMAVIDEAQMLFDADRGWAWTQAILGVPAQELILICSAYAVEAIQRLLEVCGERCDVRHFERKQHVMLLKAPVSLASLRKGDAVVAFSRREVLSLRDRITEKGHKVSVVYGALPPEVRRREAERFSGGDSHVLVATDAIGMGLNLPIRRVLFSTMTKFDGEAERDLSVSELHQIAGRAGRFGIHEEGFVGMLREGDLDGLRVMRALLARQPKAPADFKARVAPNWWHVETIAAQLGQTDLANTLGVFMKQLELDNEHFEVAALDPILQIAGHLDHRASALDLRDRFIYAQAPVNADAIGQLEHFLSWAEQHARTGQAGPPSFVQDVDEHSRLDRMEQGLRLCSLWLWLDLRFPCSYGHLDEVLALRDTLNNGIERQLKSRKPLWETRRRRRVRGA